MIGRSWVEEIEQDMHRCSIRIKDIYQRIKTWVLADIFANDLQEMQVRRLAAARAVEEKINAANEAIHEYLRYDPIWVCDSAMKMIGFRPGTPEGLAHLEDCLLLSTALIMGRISPDVRLESLAVAVKRIRQGGEFLERQGRPKIAALVAREDVREAFDLVLAEDTLRRLS